MGSPFSLQRGLTVRPLQPTCGDLFDPAAQGDQIGRCNRARVGPLDAAECCALQPITGRVGLGDQLVGRRPVGHGRRGLVGSRTNSGRRSPSDLCPTGQQSLNLAGAVGEQLSEFVQRAGDIHRPDFSASASTGGRPSSDRWCATAVRFMPSYLARVAFESPASTCARMNLASSSGVSPWRFWFSATWV